MWVWAIVIGVAVGVSTGKTGLGIAALTFSLLIIWLFDELDTQLRENRRVLNELLNAAKHSSPSEPNRE